MESFFKDILDYFLNFISQYSFFVNWDYYGGLFSKYFSVGGFIIGFIFVLQAQKVHVWFVPFLF